MSMSKILDATIQKLPEYQLEYLKIKIASNIDKFLAPQFDKFFCQVKQIHPATVALDFSNTEFIDSTGIGLLANIQEQFNKAGIKFIFIAVPKKIRQLFEMLGLNNFFQLYPNWQQAIASMIPEPQRNKIASLEALEQQVVSYPSPLNNIQEALAPPQNSEKSTGKRKPGEIKETGKSRFFTVKVDYYQRMVCCGNFPLLVAMTTNNKANLKNIWKIIPKIPGCIILPSKIELRESQLPCEFCFSITPISKSVVPAEIIIASSYGSLRHFSLKTRIATLTIPRLLAGIGLIILFFSLALDVFSFPMNKTPSFWGKCITLFVSAWIGSPLYGVIWGGLLILVGLVYYYYYRRSQRGSVQIHFYEK